MSRQDPPRPFSDTAEGPPPYSGQESHGNLHLEQPGVDADVKITNDGRLDIAIAGDQQKLNDLFQPWLDRLGEAHPIEDHPSELATVHVPKLNIVIHVVGSRGDVQPFVALGKELKTNGHRVRLATHPTFKTFVEENELEFFSIGGDPAELMAFMVKNPGLLPGVDSILAGDIGKRRKEMSTIIDGCWRSCVEATDDLGSSESSAIEETARPFIADAIIANPPSFAHVHCAEKLKIPLHIMFTMPWSPTRAFSHPLANLVASDANPNVTNYLSYALVETMTWQGLGDIINKFRTSQLGLPEIDPTFAPGMLSRLRVPHTYAWSPNLIPKPADWAAHLSIAGFFFLPLASSYTPPQDLAAFLEAGPPPIYIGFGSIVVEDPDELTRLIMKAVVKAGVRALVSKGWGGLGGNDSTTPKDIFMLGNCPHDWLFPRVSCVVHHGGAGTTAAGIAAGKPTVIVPFFGDQPFWGNMVARAGAGPNPIPYKSLTADGLSAAILEALKPEILERAVELGTSIKQENGTRSGTCNFFASLPLDKMKCAIFEDRVAVWRFKKSNVCLSTMAASLLAGKGMLNPDDLRLYGPCAWNTDHGSTDPLSATTKVGIGIISDLVSGFSDVYSGLNQDRKAKSETNSRQETSQGDGKDLTNTVVPKTESSSHTKRGLRKLGAAPFKAGMDLPASVAQGLHNVPKLYGDDTVRQPPRITGWRSGLVAGGKELGFGVYDGFTGVVTQPMKASRKESGSNVYKGIGKGLAGLLFKPLAGVSGIFGYTFKGIYEEVRKKYGSGIDAHLRASRIALGYTEVNQLSEPEMESAVRRWGEVQKTMEWKK